MLMSGTGRGSSPASTTASFTNTICVFVREALRKKIRDYFGIFPNIQSGRSSRAKNGGAYFSAVCGSI